VYLRDLAIFADELIAIGPLREKAIRFQRASFFLTDLYLRTLGRTVATAKTEKIIIDATLHFNSSREQLREQMDVMRCSRIFDLETFDELDDSAKRDALLDYVQGALLEIARVNQWETHEFKRTYVAVKALGIKHEGFWNKGKKWISPNKKQIARIFYRFDLREVVVYCVIFDEKNNEKQRYEIVKEEPSDDVLSFLLGSAKWASNSAFVLTSKRGLETWKVRIAS
jgi:hypothetical protein